MFTKFQSLALRFIAWKNVCIASIYLHLRVEVIVAENKSKIEEFLKWNCSSEANWNENKTN